MSLTICSNKASVLTKATNLLLSVLSPSWTPTLSFAVLTQAVSFGAQRYWLSPSYQILVPYIPF